MCGKGNIMKEKNVSLENKVILVTGAAGFIGSNLVMELLREVHPVHIVGIDNMNEYYDVSIKEYRLNQIEELVGKQEGSTWKFIKGSIADKVLINQIFAEDKPAVVVNLAAQAGVRYSITNPDAYVESNLVGFFNILEACRYCETLEHLVYASSSSVYGSNKKVPYSTDDKVDNPVSLYAATTACLRPADNSIGKQSLLTATIPNFTSGIFLKFIINSSNFYVLFYLKFFI